MNQSQPKLFVSNICTYISSKLPNTHLLRRSTTRPLYADYVQLTVHNENNWFQAGDVYQVDVAIDAPISWGYGKDGRGRTQPSLEFVLKPGVTIIASLRLDVMVDEEGYPFDGGYKLALVGERERQAPSRPNGFDDLFPASASGNELGLILDLTEVNYMVTSRTDIYFYVFTCLSELGGGLGLIATFCGVILELVNRREEKKKKGLGKRDESAAENEIHVVGGQL